MKKINILSLLLSSTFLIHSCKETSQPIVENGEKHRPHYHFTPDSMWMNDPNGMFYLDSTYHLFYQYYPDSTVWGPMHWGHAVSKDLISWQHKDIALYPDSLGWIFSGSAVVDSHNTSGFARNGEIPVIAIFTHHSQPKEKAGRIDFQYQSIAYSLDGGNTFTKYEGNPVVKNPGIRDFRDPKVFWYGPQNKWIMILAAQSKVMLFSSPNLKEWVFESEFGGNVGAHGGVWECPDLFELPVEGENMKKWVMLVSINPGAPNGGSGTQYFVGDFDGKTFVMDEEFGQLTPLGTGRWMDYGRDNYAGVTWSGVSLSDGGKIMMGWMSNWDYAQTLPTKKWRSAMTLARKINLIKANDNYLLTSSPIHSINHYKVKKGILKPQKIIKPIHLIKDQTNGYFSVQGENLKTGKLFFYTPDKDTLTLEITQDQYILYRNEATTLKFNDKFSGKQIAPRVPTDETFELEVFIDQSSVEIFADKGKTVMTALYFYDSPVSSVKFEAANTIISNGEYGQVVIK
jgi:fructan beta-fructosidase